MSQKFEYGIFTPNPQYANNMGVPVQCLNVLKNNRIEAQNRNSFLQLLFFAQSTTKECSSIASVHLGERGGAKNTVFKAVKIHPSLLESTPGIS